MSVDFLSNTATVTPASTFRYPSGTIAQARPRRRLSAATASLHQRLRADSVPGRAGLELCRRCGERIKPGEPWDLGHCRSRPPGLDWARARRVQPRDGDDLQAEGLAPVVATAPSGGSEVGAPEAPDRRRPQGPPASPSGRRSSSSSRRSASRSTSGSGSSSAPRSSVKGGKWAAFTVGVCAPRQNGKDGILEVRELVGARILGERLQIHSAHLADTSKEHFRRLDDLIDANDWLSKEVKHIWKTNGHEAIEFRDGCRIRFRTRTRGGGRGLSGSPTYFNEAMFIPEVSMSSILPVISAQPDPQVWYMGSAVDQTEQADGVAYARVRERALNGDHDRLAYFEWSLDVEHAGRGRREDGPRSGGLGADEPGARDPHHSRTI